MKENLFANLPLQITIEILERLPIRSIITCKSVCKSWHHLIKGGKLMMPHSQNPCLAFAKKNKNAYVVCDESFKPLILFKLPNPHTSFSNRCVRRVIIDSVNGLLLMWLLCYDHLFICNPLTKECVKVPLPMNVDLVPVFGFGVSKISGQYKILFGTADSSCYIHTLEGKRERGLWKCIEGALGRPTRIYAIFFNGNHHWLTRDLEDKNFVCCLDLETELITSFSLPRRLDGEHSHHYRLRHLNQQLYLCDISDEFRVDIWRLNNYGDTNSWTKEYSFEGAKIYGLVFPINIFANGDLVFASHINGKLFIYSKNDDTIMQYGLLQQYTYRSVNIVRYTPCFKSLASLGIHNIESLEVKTFPMYSIFQKFLKLLLN